MLELGLPVNLANGSNLAALVVASTDPHRLHAPLLSANETAQEFDRRQSNIGRILGGTLRSIGVRLGICERAYTAKDLLMALQANDINLMFKILLNNKEFINELHGVKGAGRRSILNVACRKNNIPAVRVLLEVGAMVDDTDIQIAIFNYNPDLVELLVRHDYLNKCDTTYEPTMECHPILGDERFLALVNELMLPQRSFILPPHYRRYLLTYALDIHQGPRSVEFLRKVIDQLGGVYQTDLDTIFAVYEPSDSTSLELMDHILERAVDFKYDFHFLSKFALTSISRKFHSYFNDNSDLVDHMLDDPVKLINDVDKMMRELDQIITHTHDRSGNAQDPFDIKTASKSKSLDEILINTIFALIALKFINSIVSPYRNQLQQALAPLMKTFKTRMGEVAINIAICAKFIGKIKEGHTKGLTRQEVSAISRMMIEFVTFHSKINKLIIDPTWEDFERFVLSWQYEHAINAMRKIRQSENDFQQSNNPALTWQQANATVRRRVHDNHRRQTHVEDLSDRMSNIRLG